MVQDLDLGGLLKETGVSDQVLANLDFAADLKSRGNSVCSLATTGTIGSTIRATPSKPISLGSLTTIFMEHCIYRACTQIMMSPL